MLTGLIVALVVVALIAGTVFTLKSTTRLGMPSKDVLERTKRRARELEAREKSGNDL